MKEQTQFPAFQNSANSGQCTSNSVTLTHDRSYQIPTLLQQPQKQPFWYLTSAATSLCPTVLLPLPLVSGQKECCLQQPHTLPARCCCTRPPSHRTPPAEVLHVQGQLCPVASEAKSSFKFQILWPSLDSLCPSLSPDTHLLRFQSPVGVRLFFSKDLSCFCST